MPPKKKMKKQDLKEFLSILTDLSDAYDEQGDAGRAKSFKVASENLEKFADLTKKTFLESSEDYKDVKGVGKSILELMDEFIETGGCQRLEELLDFEEIVEKRKEARTKQLHALSKPVNKSMAKAFYMIDHEYMVQRKKDAKQLIKGMDVPMRVLVAQLLREEDYLPYEEDDGTMCDYCELVRDENHSDECVCDQYLALRHAVELGCENLPDL
jgi:hypothetical protein